MDGTNDSDLYTTLLGLDEFEVVAVSQDVQQKKLHLSIVPRVTVGLCPRCGRLCEKRHECFEQKAMDLSLGGWSTELIVQLFQFECEHCHKFFTPHYLAIAPGMHVTQRLLERMAEMVRFSDIANAARFFGVAEKTLENWYYEYLERKRKDPSRKLAPITSLGIDELSLKKNTGSSAPC